MRGREVDMDSDRRVCTIHAVTSQRDDFAISTPAPSPLLPFPYVLVGMGDPGVNCGKPHLGLLCRDCFKHHWGISQCGQKQCPNCYTQWIDKTFNTAYARLTDRKNIIRNRYKRLNHIIISPDPTIANQVMFGTIPEKQMWEQTETYLQQKSYVFIHGVEEEYKKILEKYGFNPIGKDTMTIPKEKWDSLEKREGKRHLNFRRKYGICKPQIIHLIRSKYKVTYAYPDGILIYHPYRFNERANQEYRQYIAQMKTDLAPDHEIYKKWDWLRHTHPQNWRKDYVIFSPHFHFIGWTGYLAPAQKNELFVYEKKPGLSYLTNDIITKEQKKRDCLLVQYVNKQTKMVIKKLDLIRAIRYPLTHTVDRTDKKNYASYVWIGNLSTRNGKTDKEKQLEQYQDIISIKEKRFSSKTKNTCQNCGGTLGYIKPTIDNFFKKYENIPNTGWYTYPDLISRVQDNKQITPEQQENMVEILQTLENYKLGKPPPKPIEYTI